MLGSQLSVFDLVVGHVNLDAAMLLTLSSLSLELSPTWKMLDDLVV